MFFRQREVTRDIAVATRAIQDSRIEDDRQHHVRVESALTAMQANMSAGFAAVEKDRNLAIAGVCDKIEAARRELHSRISALTWKLIGAVFATGLAIVGYLLANGPPWLTHH